MKIGVIGGDGFVGSGIRRYLGSRKLDCANIERDNYSGFVGASFDVLINADGNSKKYLAEESPKEDFQASVQSVQQSLIDFKYGLYVYCSSVDVYPDREHPEANAEDAVIDTGKLSRYGFHKYLAEQIVEQYAKQWMILRFGGFMGKGLKKNSIYDILHNVPLRVNVDSQYQYLSTESAGEILWNLVSKKCENEIVNVCGDGCISLREIVNNVPEYRLRYAVESPPIEHYEVNIRKGLQHVLIPKTRESVLEFVRAFGNTMQTVK